MLMNVKDFIGFLTEMTLWGHNRHPVFVGNDKSKKVISIARHDFGPGKSDHCYAILLGNADGIIPLTGNVLASFLFSQTKQADAYCKVYVMVDGERRSIRGISLRWESVPYYSIDI